MIRTPTNLVSSLAILLCLLFNPVTGKTQAPPARAAAAAPVTTMEHISVEKLGHGMPVIFLPGLASPRAVFRGAAQAFAASNCAYLVQVNGFGGSAPEANLGPGMLQGIVADLHTYLETNHLKGVAVVGHSMGGLLGLMLAKSYPEDVGKLLIVDALPYVGDIFLPGAQVAQIEPQARRMRDASVASYGKPMDPAMAAGTAATQALHEDARVRVAQWVTTADPRVTGEAMYEDMTTDLRPEIASLQVPITLVYPFSPAMNKERAEAFYKEEFAKAPHVTFVAVADSRHFVMLDQPAAFLQALEGFLQTP